MKPFSLRRLTAPLVSSQRSAAVQAAFGLCLVLGALATAPTAHAQTRAATEPVVLNFVGAEIEAVARTMANITGRNVVVDPRVKGQVNLSTERPVSPTAALNQFAAVLRLQGFSLVDTGGLYKIVPEADAKLQGTVVNAGPASRLPASNTVVTQIFRLNHESANNLVPVLRPLIGPNNTINVNPGNNSLVITDYADNLERIGRIISALDVAGATDVDIIPLQHALAIDLVPLVARLIESGGAGGAPGQADTSFKTTLVAEPRSNSLILRAANPARAALVRSIVTRLDQPSSQVASGNIYVVYLKNANAVALATTLRAAMAGEASGGGSAGSSGGSAARPANVAAGASAGTTPVSAIAAPSTGGQIQADPATNALIITAPEPQYRQLRAVIDQLDSRRAQVYLESLIIEVSSDKVADFGVQWQLGSGTGNLVGLLGTNFSVGGSNLFDVAGARRPATGFNLGLGAQRNGEPVLGLLARFLQSTGDTNILSTPNLLTLDNEEAKIVIGANVPFVTGSFTNTGGGNNGSVNPFQTIERKDVGLTLRVKPQISENGTIKMTIFQEVSSVQRGTANATTGPSTNKRTIESTVLVDDGAIVVLGGLLEDSYSSSEEKVPGLGDVPLFGNLFKSENRTRTKKNLMVFLRPVVVRDSRETSNLALDRYELMRAIQKDIQPKQRDVMGINEAPVAPPMRASGASLPPLGSPGVVTTPVPAPATQPQAAPVPAPTQ